jgi:D-alanine-D-alanine ligase
VSVTDVIAVLLGGRSAEREVSLLSGATVIEALRSRGYQVVPVDPADADWQESLRGIHFAFNILHGPGGEDGVMQGTLQSLGVAYTGSGVLGSALAMDKLRAKQLWQGIGLSTASFGELHAASDWRGIIRQFGKVFVKPATEGSSIGMGMAATPEELHAAYEQAARYAGSVIFEQFIQGPEYTVAILGERALPSIRMETDNAFYDYEAKYLADDTRYYCPSGLSERDEEELAELALRAFRSLGCAVWGRVDVMRDADGQFYVLEVNTIPGMTSHSLVPMAARAAGLDIPALLVEIMNLSREVQRERVAG